MALKRITLEKIGGFKALVNHIADDAKLGQLIRQQGQNIAIASTLTLTTVSETSLRELFLHELRWGRTVKSVEPIGYGLSSMQLPLFWSSLPVLFQPKSYKNWFFFLAIWLSRSVLNVCIDRKTQCMLRNKILFLPLRDLLSAIVMLCSARGSRVAWRGRTVHITNRKI